MILFRFLLRLGGRVLAATTPASSTAADTSRSVLIVMIQARLTVNLRSPFQLNWSFNCQLAACSEVLAEWTRFIPAWPTPLPRFSPHYPKKKKMQWVCSILEIRLVWLNCGWCANSPKLSSDSVNSSVDTTGVPTKEKKNLEKERETAMSFTRNFIFRTAWALRVSNILLFWKQSTSFYSITKTTNTSASFKMTMSAELWTFLIKMTNDDYW